MCNQKILLQMMRIFRLTLYSCLIGVSVPAIAQDEIVRPLEMRITPETFRIKSSHNEHFIYQYEPQDLPLMDDFSIDRTRRRWTQVGDDGVTLDQVIQHLVVGGVSTPDMAYSLDTTFFYTTDITDEQVSTTRVPLPEVIVTVNDLESFPVNGNDVTAWPAYNVFDTIQSPSPDTIDLGTPDLLQDSLMVYQVAPDDGIYMMNNEPQPLVLWEDDDVFVNGTYPVLPPTIGVATFDGLSRTGIPYDFMNYSAYGIADRLTSVPINLQYPAADSIYLSFFYQARGLSGDVFGQAGDSLVLEFYAPQEDLWYRVWRSPYDALVPSEQPPFVQVMIPIKEFRYLQNGFKMRFFNYATLSGSFDHWHLDYVRLGRQRTHDDTTIVDVAYVYPHSTLLETYTSVPYNRFEQQPTTLMANSVTLQQRNLDDDDRFITYGYLAGDTDGPLALIYDDGTNTSNNASSVFDSNHPVSDIGYMYDAPIAEDANFYEARFWTNATPDINRYNDTTLFIQEISNYYAYDDGSAEASYSLNNAAGGKLAYRFDLLGGDSLRAIRMYFTPSANPPPAGHPTTGSFLLTVWNSLSPESIQHQNFTFSSPEYRSDGLYHFVEYPLDSTIYVEGTIFIGWTQTNNVSMNLGLDRNRNNGNKISYNVSGSWQNSTVQGSLMMRPVFVAAVDPWAGVEEHVSNAIGLYPNPTSSGFRVELSTEVENASIEVLDALGRVVMKERYSINAIVPTDDLSEGLHVVRVIAGDGSVIGRSKVIVQR